MNGTSDAPNEAEYKDRRGGLIVFGILEILLGFFCVLAFFGLLIARVLAPELNEALISRGMVFAAAMYGCTAAMLIWLGIGSILCRRWARSLWLIVSWSWLLMGICMLGFFALIAGDILSGMAANAALVPGIPFFAMSFLVILFIIVPGAMVLFYRSPHVKATCKARDPIQRWTDRCPLPVLTLAFWLFLGTISLLAMPVAYGSVMPWFGVLLSGTPATLIVLAFAAMGFYLGWGTYRLKPGAWWMNLGFFFFGSVSAVITFMRIDLMEYYRRLNFTDAQIEQIGSLKFFARGTVIWWIVILYILFLIYMIWIKKYFRKPNSLQLPEEARPLSS